MTDPQPPSTPIDDIIIIGARAVPGPMGGGGGGGGGEPGVEQNEVEDGNGQGPSGLTPEEAKAENQRLKDCAAQKFSNQVANHPRGRQAERFSITFHRDGNVVVTNSAEATGRFGDLPVGSAVTSSDFNNMSTSHGGITLGSIMAINHSHAADIYCNGSGLQLYEQQIENQVPSERDWVFADMVTSGNLNHGLTLYVRDCEGNVRAFDYADNQQWRQGQRPTPDPISPEGCPE